MPVLPLPGPSGIDAILMHRAKQDLLTDNNGIDADRYSFPTKASKKSHDIFEFEYESYGENSRRRTPPETAAEANRLAVKKDHLNNNNKNTCSPQKQLTDQQQQQQQPVESTATTTTAVDPPSSLTPNPPAMVSSPSVAVEDVREPVVSRDEADIGISGVTEDREDAIPSTSQHLDESNNETLQTSNTSATTSKLTPTTNFQVISKGEGFMAINATVDGVDYTGMLYSHNRNGMPGTFSADDREKFVELCGHEKTDIAVDQWMSMLADRQLLPGRQRRFTKSSWAKRRGRMICYSCLCVVPEEKSMPFACNCKDRQRQRASRLRCGGYQQTRDRLVVVAQATSGNSSGGSAAVQHSPGIHSSNYPTQHSATRHNVASASSSAGGGGLLTVSGGEMKQQACSLHLSHQQQHQHGRRNSAQLLELKQPQPSVSGESNGYDQPTDNGCKKAGRKSSAASKVTSASNGRKKSDFGKTTGIHSVPVTTISKTTKPRKNSNFSTTSAADLLSPATSSSSTLTDVLPSFPPEKMAELSKPLTCTIPDNFQTSQSAPSSFCAFGTQNWARKEKLKPTLSAPTSGRPRKKPKEQVPKRRVSVASAPWSDRPLEERSRFSERILLERAMRESLEMAKNDSTSSTTIENNSLKPVEQSASSLPSKSAPVTPIASTSVDGKTCRKSAPPPALQISSTTVAAAKIVMEPIEESTDKPELNNNNSSEVNGETNSTAENTETNGVEANADESHCEAAAVVEGGTIGEKRKLIAEVGEEMKPSVPLKVPKFDPVSVDVMPMPLDIVGKRVLDSTPQYVIRNNNNSPLQMTILKIPPPATLESNLLGAKAPQHHHHRRRRGSGNGSSGDGSSHHHHRHHNHHNTNNDDENSRRNSDVGGVDFHRHRSGSGKSQQSSQESNSGGDDERRAKMASPAGAAVDTKAQSKNTYGLRSSTRTQNNALACDDALEDVKSEFSYQLSAPKMEMDTVEAWGSASTSAASPSSSSMLTSAARDGTPCGRPIRDKRLSLEARISTIKERLLKSASISPQKPLVTPARVAAAPDALLKSTSPYAISPLKSSPATSNASTPSKFLRTPTTAGARAERVSPSAPRFASTCASALAADLPAAVTSSVSALIRAEIHRVESTRPLVVDDASAAVSKFVHGVTRGALVWARAPPSAYWPGLVIGVAEKSVKVAWCGEHTYNQVDVATVSDFLGTLATRFVPNAKENRGNKKFCNAVAEALALARPPLASLDRRLNTTVAKLLAEKYEWSLAGIAVYRGGKLVTMRTPTAEDEDGADEGGDADSPTGAASSTPRRKIHSNFKARSPLASAE